MERRHGVGFLGIFITGHKFSNVARIQAASHIQEESMTNLWSRAQLIEQVLLWTLRWAS